MKTLKKNDIIQMNGGEFKVVYLDNKDNEVRIQRTTEPMIVIAGDFNDNGIKLMGWRDFADYKIIKL